MEERIEGRRMSEEEAGLVDYIVKHFGCNTANDMAQRAGYKSAHHLVVQSNCSNLYEVFTAPGFASRYLSLEIKINSM